MSNEVKQEDKARAHEIMLSGKSRYFDPFLEDAIAAALATVRREVWQEAIRVAQMSAKKSQAASLDIAAAEILIRRLEQAYANKKGGMNAKRG